MAQGAKELKVVGETGLLEEELPQRKRAEQALRESEERYRRLIELSPDGIMIVDAEGAIHLANPAMLRMLSAESREDVVGKKISDLIAPEQLDHCYACFRGVIADQAQHARQETLFVRLDGQRFAVEVDAGYFAWSGKPAGQIIIRDITDRKRAEEEVHRRSEELAALNAIAMTVTSSLDLQEVLQTIQERVVTLLEEKYPPFFSLFDEVNQTLEVVVTGTPKKILERAEKLMGVKLEELIFPLSSVNPAVRETLLAGKPYVTDDVSDLLGPRVSRRLVQVAQSALGVNSIVDLPLSVKGKFVGIMALLSQKERVSDEVMELLSSIASQAAIAIENARLYEQAQARSAYLATLLQINATLRSTLPLSQVLETIVQGATEALGYVGSLITVPDATDYRLVFGAAWGGRFVDVAVRLTGFKVDSFGLPLKAEENSIVEAYLTGEVQTSSGAPERIVAGVEPTLSPKLARAIARTMGAELAACVPLPVGDKVVGVLSVFSPRKQLADEERTMLIGLADQAGLAIENARLYEQTRQRTSELSTLDLVGLTLASTRDLLTVLDLIVESCQQLTGTPAVHIFLYDEIAGEFTHGAGQWDREEKEPALRMPRKGGVSDTVAKQGKPLVINDARNHPLYSSPEAQSWGINAVAGFPLQRAEALLGVLYVAFFTPHTFVEDELRVLSLLANLATAAIENAQAYQRLKTQNLETISALAAAVEAKDPYTSGHSEKVTQFAIAIAEKMGLSTDEIEDLQVGALLHDIGKIGIPDSVLNKPARLTSAEFLMIKAHPVIAAEIVGKIEALTHLVPIIRHHHERYDSQGYPDGLKGKEIPLGARILAVADGFEAMTSERPYRRARTEEEALAELQKGAGSQWDPQVVEVFVKICEEGALRHQASDQ